ncbi:MAG TPA: tetratricopeptide repeat protein [Bacteroidia bacterium]|nr:tetratricopeptide repeat protein [Bacteroidia bacterium]
MPATTFSIMKLFRTLLPAFLTLSSFFAAAQKKSVDEILSLSDDTVKVNALLSHIQSIVEQQPIVADSLTDIASGIALKLKFSTALARCYYIKGSIKRITRENNSALEWYSKAIELDTETGNKKSANRTGLYVAMVLEKLNEFRKSDSISLAAMKYAEEIHDTSSICIALNNLGRNAQAQSNYNEALKYAMRAIPLQEKINNKSGMAVTYSLIGVILNQQKRYKEAIEYYNKAIDLNLELGLVHKVGMFYGNIGNSYKDLKDYKKSRTAYHKAIQYDDNEVDHKKLGNDYTNLAILFYNMKLLDSAFYYGRKALEINRMYNDERGIATTYANMALWAYEANDFEKSKTYVDSSEMLAIKVNHKHLLITTNAVKAKLKAKENNLQEAYEDLEKSIAVKDSIYNLESAKQISELMTKYETEKKQNEINQLNAEKEISTVKMARQQTVNYSLAAIAFLILLSSALIYRNVQKKREAEKQVAVLEKQNAIESMRTKIASDVHDDMGAGLTKMGLFSEQLLQSKTVTEKEKQLLEKISAQSKEVIDGMREIIWASNPANDNLKSMLGFMRQYIDRFFDGTNIRPVINFPHDIGEVVLHPEVRRNLFLILKESLNNAVKYSGSDKVDIDFNNEQEKFNLNIKDYGKGMDDKNRDAFSNGLRNMQMRAEQIQSAFKMITSPGKGVQIFIEGKLY